MGLSYQDILTTLSLCASIPAHVHTIESTSKRATARHHRKCKAMTHLSMCADKCLHVHTGQRVEHVFYLSVQTGSD